MSDYHYMKKPCQHCPFRRDVKPFLTSERGEELAYSAQNPYNSFTCHKTTVANEDADEMLLTEDSKECAGFLTLQINEGGSCPEGFEPDFENVYSDSWEMLSAYDNK